MVGKFPSFIAREKTLNLERWLAGAENISSGRWRSWADACGASCKRILNPLRDIVVVNKRGEWLITGRRAVNYISHIASKSRDMWKVRADICARKMIEFEQFQPNPLWRIVAIQEASRMAKSKAIGKTSNCHSWAMSFYRSKLMLNTIPVRRRAESWTLCAACSCGGRFSLRACESHQWKPRTLDLPSTGGIFLR